MNSLFTWTLYGIAGSLLLLSLVKDRRKTVMSLKRAWKMFLTVLPQFVGILLLVGLLLTVLTPETIRQIIGQDSGFAGMLITALTGAIAFIPVIIAFPIAAELLKNGAGIAQMAVFVSTLTMVGFVTLPMEIKFLGKKTAWLRNGLALLFSFGSAYLTGVVLS